VHIQISSIDASRKMLSVETVGVAITCVSVQLVSLLEIYHQSQVLFMMSF
jgi:hypothetical protein